MPVRIEYRQSDLPKRLVKIARKLPDVVDRTLKEVAMEAKTDFELTTETWRKSPKFKVVKDTKGWKITVNDKRFLWLDKGTDAHAIRARKKKTLSFYAGAPGSYVAKTQPNVLGSGYSYIDGRVTRVATKEVWHPGNKPRNFSRMIEKKHSRQGNKRVAQAIENHINREAPGL